MKKGIKMNSDKFKHNQKELGFVLGLVVLSTQLLIAQPHDKTHKLDHPDQFTSLVTKFAQLEAENTQDHIKLERQLSPYPRQELRTKLEALRPTADNELAYNCTFTLAYFGIDYTNNLQRLKKSHSSPDTLADGLYRIYKHNHDETLLHYLLKTAGDGVYAEGLSYAREKLLFGQPTVVLKYLTANSQALELMGFSIAFNTDTRKQLEQKLRRLTQLARQLSLNERKATARLVKYTRSEFKRIQTDQA